MVTYQKDELMTATEMVRNFSSALNSLSNGEKERLVIVKNNRLEAVVISVEMFEKMHEAMDILEKIYEKTKIKPDGK